jgi:carbon monoxide dehydrogenase subunit G
MFIIKAAYSGKFQIRAGSDQVRSFFLNSRNFVELMPNVESIKTDAEGILHWVITVNLPVVGAITQSFPVELFEDTENLLEWIPAGGEQQNFLRYSIDLSSADGRATGFEVRQAVELRRKSGKEWHALAPFAGEALISKEMGRRVTEMMETFIARAIERLEK